jgi:hypothetical protein
VALEVAIVQLTSGFAQALPELSTSVDETSEDNYYVQSVAHETLSCDSNSNLTQSPDEFVTIV